MVYSHPVSKSYHVAPEFEESGLVLHSLFTFTKYFPSSAVSSFVMCQITALISERNTSVVMWAPARLSGWITVCTVCRINPQTTHRVTVKLLLCAKQACCRFRLLSQNLWTAFSKFWCGVGPQEEGKMSRLWCGSCFISIVSDIYMILTINNKFCYFLTTRYHHVKETILRCGAD